MSLSYAITEPITFYPVTYDESGDPTFGAAVKGGKCRFEGRSFTFRGRDGEEKRADAKAFVLAAADVVRDEGNRADVNSRTYRIIAREPHFDPFEGARYETLILELWKL